MLNNITVSLHFKWIENLPDSISNSFCDKNPGQPNSIEMSAKEADQSLTFNHSVSDH